MGYVKILKNKAYSKRYQTKFRRRRQGKTDYYARKRLVINDKDKYDSKKYRFVVRRTNRRILCSIVYSTIQGDMTVTSADSQELRGYGLNCGLTNYASAYATGLLTARRLLKAKQMADMYKGNDKIDGALYSVQDHMGERRPFKAYLDVGLVRTTTGNRVFGAMKGACDGGLYIPHNEKRFPGYRCEKIEEEAGKRGKKKDDAAPKKKEVFTTEEHLEHINGVHVQEYYDLLKKDDPEGFKRQFSKWEKELKGKSFEDVYKKIQADIKKNPDRKKAAAHKKEPTRKVITKAPILVQQNTVKTKRNGKKVANGGKWLRLKKITREARAERVAKKMQSMFAGDDE
jgi:large subunit ribosomal protein L5e